MSICLSLFRKRDDSACLQYFQRYAPQVLYRIVGSRAAVGNGMRFQINKNLITFIEVIGVIDNNCR